jgi:hypothetical protein
VLEPKKWLESAVPGFMEGDDLWSFGDRYAEQVIEADLSNHPTRSREAYQNARLADVPREESSSKPEGQA